MSFFSTPERHDANAPETWNIVKMGPSAWNVYTADAVPGSDGALDRFTTKYEAIAATKPGGRLFEAYAAEGRWYAGETAPGRKSWAQCLAERERHAAWLARREAA